MAPVIVSRKPASRFSIFGHKIPGVSRSSTSLPSLIQSWCFVTPGVGPVSAAFRLESLLIKLDFPTFGIPVINSFSDGGRMPRLRKLDHFSCINLRESGNIS